METVRLFAIQNYVVFLWFNSRGDRWNKENNPFYGCDPFSQIPILISILNFIQIRSVTTKGPSLI